LDDPFRVDAKTRFVGQERHDDLAEEAHRVLVEVLGERFVKPLFDLGLLEELVEDAKCLDPAAKTVPGTARAPAPSGFKLGCFTSHGYLFGLAT